MDVVDEAIAKFREKKSSLRCNEVLKLLEGLGFRCRLGSNGKHYIVRHPALNQIGWRGTDFDGGHGANAQVKSGYIQKLIRVLEMHKEELKGFNHE